MVQLIKLGEERLRKISMLLHELEEELPEIELHEISVEELWFEITDALQTIEKKEKDREKARIQAEIEHCEYKGGNIRCGFCDYRSVCKYSKKESTMADWTTL